MDFSQFQTSKVHYGGSEEKIGLIKEGIHYLIKFQKEDELGLINNHICEYIGSSIFALFKEDVQVTSIGTYNGRKVVACMDFKKGAEEFVPFNDVGDSSLERDRDVYRYTYDNIIEMLEENRKITNVKDTVEKFWDLYIYDALLGNFDRHGSNWGFLKENGKYRMSPIFDNGSCLFPRIVTDKQCREIMNSKAELDKRTYKFPTSQIKIGRKKSSYFDVIASLKYKECNEALKRIYIKIDIKKIKKFINSLDFISSVQKEFYSTIIENRYKNILRYSYEKLVGEKDE
ncbi:MAG: HipA domain-containing protein [Candidatus Izemoplasma sp.]